MPGVTIVFGKPVSLVNPGRGGLFSSHGRKPVERFCCCFQAPAGRLRRTGSIAPPGLKQKKEKCLVRFLSPALRPGLEYRRASATCLPDQP